MDENSPQTFVDVLITEVRKNPILYDKDHLDSRNKEIRDEAWANVARAVGTSGKQSNNSFLGLIRYFHI